MRQRGEAVSTWHWNALIKGLTHSGRFEAAAELLRTMRLQHVRRDLLTYAPLIAAAAKAADDALLWRSFDDMIADGTASLLLLAS